MPRYRHDPSKNFVGFLVGDVTYAVRIELVREIVNPLTVIELPRAPEEVRGVADYRGEVVPVIDLRVRFGLPAVAPSRRHKWIVVDVGRSSRGVSLLSDTATGKFAAIVVDSVTEVFGLGGGEVRPAPPLGEGDKVRSIQGVMSYGRRLVFVLDVASFGPITDAALLESARPGAMLGGAS